MLFEKTELSLPKKHTQYFLQPNNLENFVTRRGGLYFGGVATDETTQFTFDVNEKHLLSTMDRFANLFISPLLTKELVLQESEKMNSD